MDQNQSNSGAVGEIFRSIIPLITDLIPLFFEKWSEMNGSGSVQELEREQGRLLRKLEKNKNHIRWLYSIFFVLVVWNLFLTIFLIITVK